MMPGTALIAALLLAPVLTHANPIRDAVDRASLYLESESGSQSTCTAPPEIQTRTGPVEPEMSRQRPERGPERRPHQGVLTGLATMEYGFRTRVSVELIRTDSYYCLRVAQVSVTIGGDAPRIWMHPGVHPGTCRYEVTLEHEMGHVRNYARYLSEMQRQVPGQVRRGLGRNMIVVHGRDRILRAEARLSERVTDALEALHERVYEQARRRDAAMDTPAEYRRISRLC